MADVVAQHFRSRDLDETRAFLGQFGHHTRVPHGREAFAYEFVGAASRGLATAQMKVAVRQTMRAAVREPTLFLPLQAGYVFNIGRRALQPDPSRAIFIATGHEYSAHGPAVACLGLRIDGDLLCREISGRNGQSPLEWVKARRLAAVRERLLKAPSGFAISVVALDCGFTHLGRFSAAYRRAHGELPSATLAAARSHRAERENLQTCPAPGVFRDAFWIP